MGSDRFRCLQPYISPSVLFQLSFRLPLFLVVCSRDARGSYYASRPLYQFVRPAVRQQIILISPTSTMRLGTSPAHSSVKLLNTWRALQKSHVIKVSCSYGMTRTQA